MTMMAPPAGPTTVAESSASMRETFVNVMSGLLDDDLSTALVLADISVSLFEDAARRHPDRVVNVGIREQLMISTAAGLALSGLRPVSHSITPFLVERPFEQLKIGFGHQDVGGVFVSVGASHDYSASGRTHRAPEDVALLDALPGWSVHVPGHASEAAALLRDAVAGSGRVYLRLADQSNASPRRVRPGHFVVERDGRAGTVVAVGPMLDPVLAALEGLDVTVLYAASVRPFDASTLRATLTRPDVVLVEPYLAGTSAKQVADALVDVPHRQLGLGIGNAELRHYGTPAEHDAAHGLDVATLRRRISDFLDIRA
ncbi:MAG: transketolase family protein [Nocardioidaceae bacterium]